MKAVIRVLCLFSLLLFLASGCGGRRKLAGQEKVRPEKAEKEVVVVKKPEEPSEEKLWEIVRNMDYQEDPIAKIYKGSEFLAALAKRTQPTAKPERIEEKLIFCLRIKNKKEIRTVLDYLAEATKPEEKEVAYYLLATGSLVMGEPELSLEYYNLLSSTFPASSFLSWFSGEDLQRLKKAAQEDRRIRSMEIPEDEKLWRLAGLYVDVLKVRWNEAEGSYYDLSYPYGLYKQLVQDYAESPWADNARMELLLYEESFVHEDGVADLSYTRKFEDFIREYPESDCVPRARLKIAEHYYIYACNLVNEARKMTDEAQAYLTQAETILQELAVEDNPGDVRRSAGERLAELQSFRDEHTW